MQHWECDRCKSSIAYRNPDECPDCGHTVFSPVTEEQARDNSGLSNDHQSCQRCKRPILGSGECEYCGEHYCSHHIDPDGHDCEANPDDDAEEDVEDTTDVEASIKNSNQSDEPPQEDEEIDETRWLKRIREVFST